MGVAVRNMPHRITECYLPPGKGGIPAISPNKGMRGWVSLVRVLSCMLIGRWLWQHDGDAVGQHEAYQLHGELGQEQSQAHVLSHLWPHPALPSSLLRHIVAPRVLISTDCSLASSVPRVSVTCSGGQISNQIFNWNLSSFTKWI